MKKFGLFKFQPNNTRAIRQLNALRRQPSTDSQNNILPLQWHFLQYDQIISSLSLCILKESLSLHRVLVNMSTTALQDVWQMLLSYDLSAANKRWLADHLYEQAKMEEAQPYTIEELNARIDCAEADISAGRIISRAEASERMQNYLNKYL